MSISIPSTVTAALVELAINVGIKVLQWVVKNEFLGDRKAAVDWVLSKEEDHRFLVVDLNGQLEKLAEIAVEKQKAADMVSKRAN